MNITGETGQVAFDDNGDRIYAAYEVINIGRTKDKNSKNTSSNRRKVGSFYYVPVSFVSHFLSCDFSVVTNCENCTIF